MKVLTFYCYVLLTWHMKREQNYKVALSKGPLGQRIIIMFVISFVTL